MKEKKRIHNCNFPVPRMMLIIRPVRFFGVKTQKITSLIMLLFLLTFLLLFCVALGEEGGEVNRYLKRASKKTTNYPSFRPTTRKPTNSPTLRQSKIGNPTPSPTLATKIVFECVILTQFDKIRISSCSSFWS